MEELGLLRVRVKRCYNLPVGDTKSSDPYVVIQMGDQQKLRTNVVRKDVNPKWEDEDLTFSISDPNLPIKLTVNDYDTFNKDDKMGDSVFDIKDFVEAMMKMDLRGVPAGTVIARIKPSRENCLAGESCISLTSDGKVGQDMILRLRNADCGEVEISLSWIHLSTTMVI